MPLFAPTWILACALLADVSEPVPALDPNTLMEMSLEELMQVSVASGRAQKIEEAPSIVTLVTRDDIETYGARDLADILRLVPGFEFGIDVSSLMGMMFRGVWVHEGKARIMINNLVANDGGYGNWQSFNTIPAAAIERVEIIRGPGSALYGPFAEAVVINVVTRHGKDVQGIRLDGRLSTMDFMQGGYAGEASFGGTVGDLDVSGTVGYSLQPLSRRTWVDGSGNSLPLGTRTAFGQWSHIVTQASYRGLKINFKRHDMVFAAQDGFSTVIPPINGVLTETSGNYWEGGSISYLINPVKTLTIEPYLEVSRGNAIAHSLYPGAITGNGINSTDRINRYVYELRLGYDFGAWGRLNAAAGFRRESLFSISNDNHLTLQLTSDPTKLVPEASADSRYGLVQWEVAIAETGLRGTVGGRYENTTFGAAFAPRAGLTYTYADLNVKALYGRAFRVPLPFQAWSQQFGTGGKLRPELADNYELGLAYTFTPQIRAALNGYYIDIHQPITYDGLANTYANVGSIRSAGAEAEVTWRAPSYGGFVNLSYSHPVGGTSRSLLSGDRQSFLGMPPLKVSLGGYARVSFWEFGPSLVILTPRQAQDPASMALASASPPVVQYTSRAQPAVALLNLSIKARDFLRDWFSGLDATLTVHNIVNQPYTLVQPYYGSHTPMPANDRQINLWLTWNLPVEAMGAPPVP